MSLPINDFAITQQYTSGVMAHVECHAGNVIDKLLSVMGGVIWRADPGSLEVRSYGTKTANMLGFTVTGHRYCVAHTGPDLRIDTLNWGLCGPTRPDLCPPAHCRLGLTSQSRSA